jgi:hypothetical protein
LEVLHNHICDLVRGVTQLISAAGSVGKNNSEEDRRLATPILPKIIRQTHDIGAQRRLEIVDSLVELCLMYKSSGDHDLIIARSW